MLFSSILIHWALWPTISPMENFDVHFQFYFLYTILSPLRSIYIFDLNDVFFFVLWNPITWSMVTTEWKLFTHYLRVFAFVTLHIEIEYRKKTADLPCVPPSVQRKKIHPHFYQTRQFRVCKDCFWAINFWTDFHGTTVIFGTSFLCVAKFGSSTDWYLLLIKR